MRLVFEILIIGALIYLAWDMPLKQRADQVQAAVRAAAASKQPATAPQEPVVAPVAQTTTPVPLLRPIQRATVPPGAWMWDPKRQSALDRPAYGQTQPVQRYQDPSGRSYWIDAQGVRHYDQ
jgi:hypothetical protein